MTVCVRHPGPLDAPLCQSVSQSFIRCCGGRFPFTSLSVRITDNTTVGGPMHDADSCVVRKGIHKEVQKVLLQYFPAKACFLRTRWAGSGSRSSRCLLASLTSMVGQCMTLPLAARDDIHKKSKKPCSNISQQNFTFAGLDTIRCPFSRLSVRITAGDCHQLLSQQQQQQQQPLRHGGRQCDDWLPALHWD